MAIIPLRHIGWLAMSALLIVTSDVAVSDDLHKANARKHQPPAALGFCSTPKSRRTPECANLPDEADVGDPAKGTGTAAAAVDAGHADKASGSDFNVGVRWRASSDKYGANDQTRATVDSINRTVEGSQTSQQDTQIGLGANWRICLFCGQ